MGRSARSRLDAESTKASPRLEVPDAARSSLGIAVEGDESTAWLCSRSGEPRWRSAFSKRCRPSVVNVSLCLCGWLLAYPKAACTRPRRRRRPSRSVTHLHEAVNIVARLVLASLAPCRAARRPPEAYACSGWCVPCSASRGSPAPFTIARQLASAVMAASCTSA